MRRARPVPGPRRTAGVGLPRQPGDLAVPKLDDHPAAVTTPGQVHREEPAPHGGGDVGELLDRRLGGPVLALGPVGSPEDRDAIEPEGPVLLRQRHPAPRVDADRLELDVLPEDQALGEVLALEFQEPPDDPCDGLPVGGRGDEARLGPLVLPALHEVLDDDGGVPERGQGLHDPVDAQVAGQPDGPRRVPLDDRVVLGQVVAVAVLLRVVDQADVPGSSYSARTSTVDRPSSSRWPARTLL